MASLDNCTVTISGNVFEMIGSQSYSPTLRGVGEMYYQMGEVSPIGSSYAIPKTEEVEEMRGLFAVYVVDPVEGDVVYQGVVVARDAKNAEFKVLSAAMRVTENEFEVDDLDVISVRLGNVSAKKGITTVRVVE